ncbi:putative holin-like toxin [Bacillaceae bacterium C204]
MGSGHSLRDRKGVTLVITIKDAIEIMIAFASLIVAVIAVTNTKK